MWTIESFHQQRPACFLLRQHRRACHSLVAWGLQRLVGCSLRHVNVMQTGSIYFIDSIISVRRVAIRQ